MRRAPFLFFVVLVSVPRAAWAQGNPVGPEFRVNTYTTDYQFAPVVAVGASGNFVVVWQSDQRGQGVFGQRYASSGVPLGPEFPVNTQTNSQQQFPAVAGSDTSGNFVVVWQATYNGPSGSGDGIFGQRYASSGAPLGPEFRVNTYTTDIQFDPAVAADPTGNFVVVWTTSAQPLPPSNADVFGQRYASSGAPLGSEFRVNTYTTLIQSGPSVVSTGSGDFVVVWQSGFGQDGAEYGVFGQRYASSGAPLGPEFRVNTHTTWQQYRPSVAADFAGDFVVVWYSTYPAPGVFGQRYASSGAPLGPEFRVNTNGVGTYYLTSRLSIGSDSSGNFVVLWNSYGQDGSDAGVFGQRYASSGIPLGPEFRVNTYTTASQIDPSVAADSSGNFVVVWNSYGQDGSSWGVFGQRYSQIVPVELMHFRIE